MSKVCGCEKKNIPRNDSSIIRLPMSVNRKNLMAAYSLRPLPQIPMMKYIGISTSSQNTKNSTRSKATKVPAIPVSKSSIKARKAFALPGAGRFLHV